jgi:hypothetical protein
VFIRPGGILKAKGRKEKRPGRPGTASPAVNPAGDAHFFYPDLRLQKPFRGAMTGFWLSALLFLQSVGGHGSCLVSRNTYQKGADMGTSKRKSNPGRKGTGTRSPDVTAPGDDIERDAIEGESAGAPSGGQMLDFPDFGRTRLAERIEPDEVNGWARQLGVSPERLREAIRMAGDNVEDVKRYLTKPH